jgi:phosphohistidine phosphatase
MKTLFILRHGKALPMASTDFDRALAPRGRRDAEAVSKVLAARLHPDSPGTVSAALRTRETAEWVARASGWRIPEPTGEAYLAHELFWVQSVADWPEDQEVGIVVGHNPGLSNLVSALTNVETWLPTCGLAEVQFDATRWAEVSRGTGTLVGIWTPKSNLGA